MNTQRISLDLSKRTGTQQIVIAQGDASGTTIVATIYDNGTKLAETGVTAQFLIELPDGKHYVRDNATYNAGVITYVCDESKVASVHGYTDNAYFTLTKGNTIVSTERFAVIVKPCAYDGMEVGENYDTAIDEAIQALADAVADMPSTVEDVLADHPEWTTTVQDGSITKAKLATDLARDRERLMYRLDNLLTATLPEGETATATDAAKTPVAGLALYGRSTQDGTPTPSAPVAIQSVTPDSDGNISLWAQGKNLLQPQQAGTFGGVTFTVNEDGSVTLNGTATTTINQSVQFVVPETGAYALSGCPAGGGSSKYQLWTYDTTEPRDPQITDTGSGGTGTLTKGHVISVRIRIQSGYACSNLTFYPQLEAGSTATAYQPYAESVTPIDLDGHALRSLPDGTRDELAVDADGHAVLVQRVGHVVLDGSSDENYTLSGNKLRVSYVSDVIRRAPNGNTLVQLLSDRFVAETSNQNYAGNVGASIGTEGYIGLCRTGAVTTVAAEREWLASNPTTVDYPLATPVTHDLGYVAAVPLCGPDLTAQAVPTAPMQLTYERDLNTTLARLESAIADVATS